jgi:hypothetical protein
MINEHKKGVKAMKHTTKSKGVEPPKPRNFVAKNAINTGAGAHKDKKKAAKQGDVKHKKQEYAESLQDKLATALKESNVEEAKSAREKFAQASYEREKNRKEFEKSIAHLPWEERMKKMRGEIEKNLSKKDVAEGGGGQPAAIAIAKRESGKYTKDGKRKKNSEGWTHESLAAELFETPSYETRLQEMLDGQVAFMEGGTEDGVTMFSKSPGSHQHKNDAGKEIPDTKMKSAQPSKNGSKDEYDQEGEYLKNQLHTIKRVVTHLEHAIDDDENLPEWVQDKISQAKGMIVSVMDYMISEKEMAMNKQTGRDDDIMA